MDDPECMVELICDGYHIHPSAIRAAFRLFGPERVILISDSMRSTGMENGTYELGGQEVTVKDRKAVLKDGTLAGSATNLYGCMCKAIEFGIPLEQAIWRRPQILPEVLEYLTVLVLFESESRRTYCL